MAFSGRFGMLPAALTRCEAIGLDEIGVLAVMSTYADREGHCRVSQSTVARILKRSRPWVIKTLNSLEELRLVERTQVFDRKTGARRACAYRLRFDLLPGASEIHPESRSADGMGDDDHAEFAPAFLRPERDRDCHRRDTIQTTPEQAGFSPDARERQSARQVPPDWCPTEADLAWASETHPWLDTDLLTRQFIAGSTSKGYRYQDFSAGWRSWAENQATWRKTDDFRQSSHEPLPPRTGPNRPGQNRSWPNRSRTELAASNDAAARACLERILARRTVAASAD
jgi:hypothetical protein